MWWVRAKGHEKYTTMQSVLSKTGGTCGGEATVNLVTGPIAFAAGKKGWVGG